MSGFRIHKQFEKETIPLASHTQNAPQQPKKKEEEIIVLEDGNLESQMGLNQPVSQPFPAEKRKTKPAGMFMRKKDAASFM